MQGIRIVTSVHATHGHTAFSIEPLSFSPRGAGENGTNGRRGEMGAPFTTDKPNKKKQGKGEQRDETLK